MIDDKPWIETVGGTHFHFLDPSDDEIDIEDIAYSLANLCRFNGHCDRFYSVAEHSVFVSSLLPKELQLAGLLHDASEAYLADIPSPIKAYLPDYKKLEAPIQSAVFRKFKLPNDVFTHEQIKVADIRQLQTEALVMLPSQGFDWDTYDKTLEEGHRPAGYPPNMAYTFFMKAFQHLTKTEHAIQLI